LVNIAIGEIFVMNTVVLKEAWGGRTFAQDQSRIGRIEISKGRRGNLKTPVIDPRFQEVQLCLGKRLGREKKGER
jgi:hypothetical protein